MKGYLSVNAGWLSTVSAIDFWTDETYEPIKFSRRSSLLMFNSSAIALKANPVSELTLNSFVFCLMIASLRLWFDITIYMY